MLYLLYIAKSASKPPEYNTKESCWNIFLAYISFSSSYPRPPFSCTNNTNSFQSYQRCCRGCLVILFLTGLLSLKDPGCTAEVCFVVVAGRGSGWDGLEAFSFLPFRAATVWVIPVMATWSAFSTSPLILPKAVATAETKALNRSQRKDYPLLRRTFLWSLNLFPLIHFTTTNKPGKLIWTGSIQRGLGRSGNFPFCSVPRHRCLGTQEQCQDAF